MGECPVECLTGSEFELEEIFSEFFIISEIHLVLKSLKTLPSSGFSVCKDFFKGVEVTL